jgi:hypothetical protein
MTQGRLSRLLFGTRERIAGTVYGTVVVMGAVTAGAGAETEAWRLAAFSTVTVIVLWIAHVYADGLGESIQRGRRLDRTEFADVARRELPIALAAAGPVAFLLLGAVGVVRESRAIWLALAFGVASLGVQGVRYARVERMTRMATFVSVAINLALGLTIVGMKAALAH